MYICGKTTERGRGKSMSLKEQIESGKVFTEYGHTAQEDREYEKIIEAQRRKSKQLCFRYNQTDPMDEEGREKLVRELLGGTGKRCGWKRPSTLPTAVTRRSATISIRILT